MEVVAALAAAGVRVELAEVGNRPGSDGFVRPALPLHVAPDDLRPARAGGRAAQQRLALARRSFVPTAPAATRSRSTARASSG